MLLFNNKRKYQGIECKERMDFCNRILNRIKTKFVHIKRRLLLVR